MFRLQNVFVPAGGQQRTDGRFANFTTVTFAVFRQQFFEGFNAFNADQMEQFLTRISKVFTWVVVNFDTLFRQFRVQYLSDQRNTTAAARTAFPALAFSAATVWQPLLIAAIRSPLVTSKQEQICALSGSLSTPIDGLPLPECAGESENRVFRQFDSVQHQLQQVAVVAGIAHQYRTERGLLSSLTIRRL